MSQPLRILVVEDDLSFSLELEMLVERMGYRLAGAADSSEAALARIEQNPPDFILMDIDIKGALTGIEVAERIRHRNIPVLFITSFADETHYQSAQATGPVGYLVKPINRYSIETAISLALRAPTPSAADTPDTPDTADTDAILSNGERFFVKKQGLYHRVPVAAILAVQSAANYCDVHTTGGDTYVVRRTLSSMETLLGTADFVRTHRQYLIRLSAIERIDFHDGVVVAGGRSFPLSRTRAAELERQIRRME